MKEIITADTVIVKVLEINPKAAEILQKYGMRCLGCALAHGETLGQAAQGHGANLDAMLKELNA